MNPYLWDIVNAAGWWFWLPFIGYAVYGLSIMYRLAPAETGIGRLVRVMFTVGFLCMIFIPALNGTGPFAFHLIAIGLCLWLKQTYDACVKAGKIKPAEGHTIIERQAERMTARK